MAYSLSTHYAGQGLLDSFSFFTGNDPSHGFVDYQSRDDAVANNLVTIDDANRVRLGVDSNNTYTTRDKGRPSVRLTSNDEFTHGLFIADFAHMPASSCGTWPAFWAFNNQDDGENWPMGGEVDIIEGANTAERNLFSAHTTEGCEAPGNGFIGVQGETDCSPDMYNYGCNYLASTADTTSYGDVFNAEGGGVYALEWTSDDLKIWHFPRSQIPGDIAFAPVSTPDPSTWGPPQARFGGSSCDPDTYFYNMSNNDRTSVATMLARPGIPLANVVRWPLAAKHMLRATPVDLYRYWDINYIDVYQRGSSTNATNPSGPSTTRTSTLSSTMTSTVSSNGSSTTPLSTRTITLTTQVTATAQPTQPGGGLNDPSAIGDYSLLGCFGSSSGYQSFSPIASLPRMDAEACVASCRGRKYAGVSGENCYCADILGDASAVANDMCNTPCPGNGREFCGGAVDASESAQLGFIGTNTRLNLNASAAFLPNHTASSSPRRRAAPSDILLTVYADLTPGGDDGPVGGAPAMGGEGPTPTPSNATTTVTVTYTTVCATNAALLVEVEYCATVTYEDCGCARRKELVVTPPPVPMATCTETCRGCGPNGESTVTLTVPSAVQEVVVTAVAVQTVVPLVNTTILGNGGGVNVTLPVPVGGGVPPVVAPSPPAMVPVQGAASGLNVAVGWGLGLGIGVFGLVVL